MDTYLFYNNKKHASIFILPNWAQFVIRTWIFQLNKLSSARMVHCYFAMNFYFFNGKSKQHTRAINNIFLLIYPSKMIWVTIVLSHNFPWWTIFGRLIVVPHLLAWISWKICKGLTLFGVIFFSWEFVIIHPLW